MPAITGLMIIVTIVAIVEPVEIAPVHHDGVARGAAGTGLVVIPIDVKPAGTGELTPRPADDARGRPVPSRPRVSEAAQVPSAPWLDAFIRHTRVGAIGA